jgi:hypothetical protein
LEPQAWPDGEVDAVGPGAGAVDLRGSRTRDTATRHTPAPGVVRRVRGAGCPPPDAGCLSDVVDAPATLYSGGDTTDRRAALLRANLPGLADDLAAGAVVTFSRDRVSIRSLPLHSA